MITPRAIRLPRAPTEFPRTPRPRPNERAAAPPAATGLRRPNRAGTQRAVRLTLVYLIVLALLYLGFVLYDRTAPGGTSPGAQAGLIDFSGVAVVLAAVGALLVLSPAPRSVERSSTSLVVVGRWGRRTEWAPVDEVIVRTVRRYPAGLLSDEPVDSVEVSSRGRRARSYLIEAGLLSEGPAGDMPR
jgi:hypothetical protein